MRLAGLGFGGFWGGLFVLWRLKSKARVLLRNRGQWNARRVTVKSLRWGGGGSLCCARGTGCAQGPRDRGRA